MVCRGVFLAAAVLCVCRASAVVTLFDFETEEERRAAPNVRSSDGTMAVSLRSCGGVLVVAEF